MKKDLRGFSILELMIAMTITLGIGMIAFQLFQQNERVFRDQNLMIEMEQSARAVASLIADELRMAGQGIPVYSSKFDGAALTADLTSAGTTATVSGVDAFPSSGTVIIDSEYIEYTGKTATTLTGLTRAASSTTAAAHSNGAQVWQKDSLEASQTVLDGSGAATIRFRAGMRNVFTRITTPLTYTSGASAVATVDDAQAFSDVLGAVPAAGRYAFIWGPTSNSWGWIRAQVTAVSASGAPETITMTPSQNGSTGTTFTGSPTNSLEEAVSYRRDASNNLLRSTSTDFSSLTAPNFTTNETTVGTNFTQLAFTYYDSADAAITIGSSNTLMNRNAVRRIDVQVVVQTAQNTSRGTRPTYAISLRTYPRNVGIK